MNILLAQTELPAGSGEVFKMVITILAWLLGIALVILTIIYMVRKPAPVKIDDNPPAEFRKAAKRYNHDLAEQRYAEVTRRLDAHDNEIKEIQEQRAEALVKINDRFERVLIWLSSIGAKVGAKSPDKNE